MVAVFPPLGSFSPANAQAVTCGHLVRSLLGRCYGHTGLRPGACFGGPLEFQPGRYLMRSPWRVLAVAGLLIPMTLALGTDIEREPINYSQATPRNVVSRLQERIDAGTAKLEYDEDHGYLKSLLRELGVPVESQVLVFSKTSLQRHRIGPKTPRAVYFNGDVDGGGGEGGGVMEGSAVEPQLGGVFYTLDQSPGDRLQFKRQNDNCMICHGSSLNDGLPGHLVRSVYADGQGN